MADGIVSPVRLRPCPRSLRRVRVDECGRRVNGGWVAAVRKRWRESRNARENKTIATNGSVARRYHHREPPRTRRYRDRSTRGANETVDNASANRTRPYARTDRHWWREPRALSYSRYHGTVVIVVTVNVVVVLRARDRERRTAVVRQRRWLARVIRNSQSEIWDTATDE